MYLKHISINNFRSFEAETIELSPDINILVGENNGGKSNAIDAIRLATAPLGGRRELYCEPSDVRFGSAKQRFELEVSFAELSVAQQGRFISAAADDTLETATFGLVYDEGKGAFPVRPSLWAGKLRTTPEPGCHDMVRHVYLPPLRDAKRALASGNPTRVYALLKFFLDGGDPDELAKNLQRTASDPILKKVDSAVDVGLEALTAGVRRQSASLGFAQNEKLIDIARDLRFKLADHGIEPEDLRYSGHGYANLLYMATIAVELENMGKADLTLFLVEEPEAHLHPQLQAAVLCFLEEQAEKSRVAKEGYDGPAGELQIVVATHSPNLSAWVDHKKVVYFRSTIKALPAKPEGDVAVPAAADAPAAVPPPRKETRCIPLRRLNLTDVERRKIDRYLDVTKSALLFGGRVLLVEGAAEALLLPVIAKHKVLKGKAEQMRLFRSAVFVPIDGVEFEPYLKLLLTPFSDVRVADRVVVVTDGDGAATPDGVKSPGQLRKENFTDIAEALTATAVHETIVSLYSLESELVRAGNADLMKKVFLELHPKSEAAWNDAVGKAGNEQALAVQKLFENRRKGDFAQLIAERIVQGEAFSVPEYLKEAIEAVVK